MDRMTAPGGWVVEQRQYALASLPSVGKRGVGGPGDGTVLVVTCNGARVADCRSVAEVAAVMGAAYENLS